MRNQLNVAQGINSRPALIGPNVIGGPMSSGQTTSGPMSSSSPYMNMMFKSPLTTPGKVITGYCDSTGEPPC